MGYSISVSFSKKENQEKIKTFLQQNQELLEKLYKTDSRIPYFTLDIYDETNLVYAPKKRNLLGFYGSGIPHYAWAICAWMAVQSNPKKPFLYYDDEPLEIIYENQQEKNEKRTIVNQNGIMVLPKKSLTSQLLLGLFDIGFNHKKEQEILTKLHDKWLVFQKNLKNQPISKKSLKSI